MSPVAAKLRSRAKEGEELGWLTGFGYPPRRARLLASQFSAAQRAFPPFGRRKLASNPPSPLSQTGVANGIRTRANRATVCCANLYTIATINLFILNERDNDNSCKAIPGFQDHCSFCLNRDDALPIIFYHQSRIPYIFVPLHYIFTALSVQVNVLRSHMSIFVLTLAKFTAQPTWLDYRITILTIIIFTRLSRGRSLFATGFWQRSQPSFRPLRPVPDQRR